MLNGALFQIERPLSTMASQATMSLYYKPFHLSGPTFQHKGAPFHPMNFHFIDEVNTCFVLSLPMGSLSAYNTKSIKRWGRILSKCLPWWSGRRKGMAVTPLFLINWQQDEVALVKTEMVPWLLQMFHCLMPVIFKFTCIVWQLIPSHILLSYWFQDTVLIPHIVGWGFCFSPDKLLYYLSIYCFLLQNHEWGGCLVQSLFWLPGLVLLVVEICAVESWKPVQHGAPV